MQNIKGLSVLFADAFLSVSLLFDHRTCPESRIAANNREVYTASVQCMNCSVQKDVVDLVVSRLAPGLQCFKSCYALRLRHPATDSTLPTGTSSHSGPGSNKDEARWLPNDCLLYRCRDKYESFRPSDEWR